VPRSRRAAGRELRKRRRSSTCRDFLLASAGFRDSVGDARGNAAEDVGRPAARSDGLALLGGLVLKERRGHSQMCARLFPADRGFAAATGAASPMHSRCSLGLQCHPVLTRVQHSATMRRGVEPLRGRSASSLGPSRACSESRGGSRPPWWQARAARGARGRQRARDGGATLPGADSAARRDRDRRCPGGAERRVAAIGGRQRSRSEGVRSEQHGPQLGSVAGKNRGQQCW